MSAPRPPSLIIFSIAFMSFAITWLCSFTVMILPPLPFILFYSKKEYLCPHDDIDFLESKGASAGLVMYKLRLCQVDQHWGCAEYAAHLGDLGLRGILVPSWRFGTARYSRLILEIWNCEVFSSHLGDLGLRGILVPSQELLSLGAGCVFLDEGYSEG